MYKPSEFPREKQPPTIFNRIEAEVARRALNGERVIALHVGDAHMELPDQLSRIHQDEEKLFGTHLNRYGDTFGELPLREILATKLTKKNNLKVEGVDNIQVTNGATGVLQAGFSRLLGADSEILVLSPYWSILRVVAKQANVKIVEVPFFDLYLDDPKIDISGLLGKYLSGKTRGIYINTPSNPTGLLLSDSVLEQIVSFAEVNDLWIFSDEAYEDFIWSGSEHLSIGSLPGAYERTVSVFTFSKCFGASGMRVGYAVAPAPVISVINHGVVGSIYQVGRYDQLMAWRGMMAFEEVLKPIYDDYYSTWKWAAENLEAMKMPCEAGFYFFVKLGSEYQNLPPVKKVDMMLDAGVVLSPGEYFGEDYEGWARLCFTVVSPDELKEGVARFNRIS